jgi:dTDP-4-amino-4,6-dideoxygalactose transaminase
MIRPTPTTEPLQLPSDQNASGRTFGPEELEALAEAVRSGTLTATKGSQVKALEQRFAETWGVDRALACTSGTAALHTALAAVDPEPGDEIITAPITDMGAITPILYQTAVPVFADVDPHTYNVTAETIARVISPRTKAIIVTHLFGNPCEMGPIMELARSHGIPVIEDCAQAYLARYDGRLLGTIGEVGCFSLQQGKHITTGEGGLLTTSDAELARRSYLFINKAWGYGDPKPDHYFLALNYRMNELTGAVALAQLEKLQWSVERRQQMAERLTELLQEIPGLEPPVVTPGGEHTYWKYCLRVDPAEIPGGTDALGGLLRQRGVGCAPRYIQKPAFACEVLRDRRTFGDSGFPFTSARPEAVAYDAADYPGTLDALAHILVLAWNECYTREHVDAIAEVIRQSVAQLKEEN